MDNKQLIHIACEGIVIGSVSLYFAKQLKKANKEIEELKEIISKNQGANEKRFEVLFNMLDNLNTQPRRKIVPQQPQKKVIFAPIKKNVSSVKKKVTPIEEEDDDIEEEIKDDDLEEETRSLLEEDVEEDIEA
jgi:septal ring factor EnvC (AmiA/AmiB activator)